MHSLIEGLLGRPGNFGLQFQMAFGDLEAALFLFQTDGANRVETGGGQPRLRQLSGQRHGKTAGMRGREQLLGIGALPVFKSAVERVGRIVQYVGRCGERTLAAFQIALPMCLCGSLHM